VATVCEHVSPPILPADACVRLAEGPSKRRTRSRRTSTTRSRDAPDEAPGTTGRNMSDEGPGLPLPVAGPARRADQGTRRSSGCHRAARQAFVGGSAVSDLAAELDVGQIRTQWIAVLDGSSRIARHGGPAVGRPQRHAPVRSPQRKDTRSRWPRCAASSRPASSVVAGHARRITRSRGAGNHAPARFRATSEP
jgi:hypothetical protein